MGYLDAYGVADARRGKVIRYLVLGTVLAVLAGITLYFLFRDYSEERQLARFFELLGSGDYKGAYALWGCTDNTPCRDYRFEKFMEDWGPQGLYRQAPQAEVVKTRSCETGLIRVYRIPGAEESISLGVDRRSELLSFAPGLRDVPEGFRWKVADLMWRISRNCDPLVAP
jgi:hypothetical protein